MAWAFYFLFYNYDIQPLVVHVIYMQTYLYTKYYIYNYAMLILVLENAVVYVVKNKIPKETK